MCEVDSVHCMGVHHGLSPCKRIRNPESGIHNGLESGIHFGLESGIQRVEIQNPDAGRLVSGIQDLRGFSGRMDMVEGIFFCFTGARRGYSSLQARLAINLLGIFVSLSFHHSQRVDALFAMKASDDC